MEQSLLDRRNRIAQTIRRVRKKDRRIHKKIQDQIEKEIRESQLKPGDIVRHKTGYGERDEDQPTFRIEAINGDQATVTYLDGDRKGVTKDIHLLNIVPIDSPKGDHE